MNFGGRRRSFLHLFGLGSKHTICMSKEVRLSSVGAQVAVVLERARLYDLAQAQRTRLERELEMACAVQASLLPGQLPNIPHIGLAASWRSAREVAGDFHDIFPVFYAALDMGSGVYNIVGTSTAGLVSD